MQELEDITITITPQNPETRWVAIDKDNNIISEGKTAGDAIKDAKKTGKEFTLMFIPLKGNTYIF